MEIHKHTHQQNSGFTDQKEEKDGMGWQREKLLGAKHVHTHSYVAVQAKGAKKLNCPRLIRLLLHLCLVRLNDISLNISCLLPIELPFKQNGTNE